MRGPLLWYMLPSSVSLMAFGAVDIEGMPEPPVAADVNVSAVLDMVVINDRELGRAADVPVPATDVLLDGPIWGQ